METASTCARFKSFQTTFVFKLLTIYSWSQNLRPLIKKIHDINRPSSKWSSLLPAWQ